MRQNSLQCDYKCEFKRLTATLAVDLSDFCLNPTPQVQLGT